MRRTTERSCVSELVNTGRMWEGGLGESCRSL